MKHGYFCKGVISVSILDTDTPWILEICVGCFLVQTYFVNFEMVRISFPLSTRDFINYRMVLELVDGTNTQIVFQCLLFPANNNIVSLKLNCNTLPFSLFV